MNGLQPRAHRRNRREIRKNEIGLTQNAGEDVVEVVGYATGEHTEALKLLIVLNLGLKLTLPFFPAFLVCDVFVGSEHTDNRPIEIAERKLARPEPDLFPVRGRLGFFVVYP